MARLYHDSIRSAGPSNLTGMLLAGVMYALGLAISTPAHPASLDGQVKHTLHSASVVLDNGSCSGVLAGSADVVFTARHCIKRKGETLRLRFTDGERRTARVADVDEVADQAMLVLDEAVAIEPLPLV